MANKEKGILIKTTKTLYNMNKLFFLFSFIILSCNMSSVGLFQKESKNYVKLKDNIIAKLLEHNPRDTKDDFSNIEIWVRPVLINKDSIGVFNYGVVGSHHSKKNISDQTSAYSVRLTSILV